MGIDVHLVDGTYELFRYHYAPNNRDPRQGAVRGVLGSVLGLLESGATHVGVATDHVIESFRNDMWVTYKDGSGIDPNLKAQFVPLEAALAEMGVPVWAMVEVEADDALGAAALMAAADDRVERVLICTPDKDLGQCVGGKVVQWDRRQDKLYDAAGVEAKFGVPPESIPDFLALVGDSADGFPGLAGFGAKSAAAVLARFGHLEHIPPTGQDWGVAVRNAGRLAATLVRDRDLAFLFRRLATLETSIDGIGTVDELRWTGARPGFADLCRQLDAGGLADRADRLALRRS
jgi:5'-3' exonuclease